MSLSAINGSILLLHVYIDYKISANVILLSNLRIRQDPVVPLKINQSSNMHRSSVNKIPETDGKKYYC